MKLEAARDRPRRRPSTALAVSPGDSTLPDEFQPGSVSLPFHRDFARGSSTLGVVETKDDFSWESHLDRGASALATSPSRRPISAGGAWHRSRQSLMTRKLGHETGPSLTVA